MKLTLARSPARQALAGLFPGHGGEEPDASYVYAPKPHDPAARRQAFLELLDGWTGPDRQCWLRQSPSGLEGFGLYRRSAWDTEAFGVPAGFLEAVHAEDPAGLPGLVRALTRRLASRGETFIVKKVPLDRPAEVQALEAAGFRLADCELVFGLSCDPAGPVPTPAPPPGVRLARNPDLPADASLRLPLHPNRFAADPRIGPDKAAVLWNDIVARCLRQYGDSRFVALAGDRPVGLVCLFETTVPGEALPTGRLFLVGCDPAWQGTGLMAALMIAVREYARTRCARLLVETSAGNHRAQAFYIKSGFNRIVASRASLHLWTR